MNNAEGKKIPEIKFKIQKDNQWAELSTKEMFDNKKVIVFGLPGAFTPTCTSAHLPRYEALYNTFKENGVDEVYCLSVNDTFVMNSWAENLDVRKVKMLPDGNGELSEAVGMLVDKSAIGFGKRSWRYAMIIENGEITKMFIEPEKAGDPFEVSDADNVLDFINPKAEKPQNIVMITKPGCPHCKRAKDMLHDQGMDFEELVVGKDLSLEAMYSLSQGNKTTPQIFIGEKLIGGADQLQEYLNSKKQPAMV
jgi:glutaredoxin-like protein